MKNNVIGAQLYVWSQVLGKDGKSVEDELERVLAETAEAGFEAVEGSMPYIASPEKARRFRELLDANGLTQPSVYCGGQYHTKEEGEKTLAETREAAPYAIECGCQMVNVNPAPIGRAKTDEELQIQADNLNRVGAALRELELTFVTHHHHVEIQNGAHEFRSNIAKTSPELVGLCVDTHWVLRGGEDPLAILDECGSLVKSLHIRNSRDGVWTEDFGDGEIDYHAVRAILEKHEFAGPIYVELAYEAATEITRPLKEDLRRSREYVRRVFGL